MTYSKYCLLSRLSLGDAHIGKIHVPWANPKLVTEYYIKMVDSYVDNVISATNLVNSLVVFNMESNQRLADSTKEYWRLGVENARAISKSTREE